MERSKLAMRLLILILMILPHAVSAADYRIIPLEHDDPADLAPQAMNESGQVAGCFRSTGLGFFWHPTTGLQQISSNGDFCSPVDINDAGQVFGYLGKDKAFLWDNVNGLQSIAEGIFVYDIGGLNNLGQVAGILINDNNETEVFIWDRTSGVQVVGSPGGWIDYLSGINDSGQIAGCYDLPWPINEWHGFVWDEDSGMHILGTLGGSHSYPLGLMYRMADEWNTGINNSGQVVGASELENGNWHYFIWDRFNGMKDTGIPFYGDGEAQVLGINENGELAGCFNERAFFWDPDSGMIDLGAPTGLNAYSLAEDFNSVGQVVGRYRCGSFDCYAFVWDKTNGFQDLSSYTEGPAVALRINDSGQILCRSITNDSYFLLSPTTDQNPTAPALSLPSNGATGVDPNNAVLQWNPSTDPDGDAIEYCVTINEDSEPNDIPVAVGCNAGDFTTDTSDSFALDPGKVYRWSVKAVDEYDNETESEWWSFSTKWGPKLYGLFLGTEFDDYSGGFSAKLARDTFLNLPNVQATVLTAAESISEAQIETDINALKAQMNPGDQFFLYITGHGGRDIFGGENTITAADELVRTGQSLFGDDNYLTDDELYSMLIGMADIEKWVFIDACYGGGFWGDYTENGGDLEQLANISFIASSLETTKTGAWSTSLFPDAGPIALGALAFYAALGSDENGYFNPDLYADGTITFQEISDSIRNFVRDNPEMNGQIVIEMDAGDPYILSEDTWTPTFEKSDDFMGVLYTNTANALIAEANGPYNSSVGSPITFDASSSHSPNGDIVLYEWDWDNDGIYDESTTSPIITHTWDEIFSGTVGLKITDNEGLTEIDNASVEVIDNTPPDISVSVSPGTLWPPNHKMVLITPTITASDNCDPNPSIALESITMNEGEETNAYDPNYDSTIGDGHTLDDIQVDEDGNIYLRAERSGTGIGRIYTITYAATDASGNSATTSATVTVPHDQ